MKNFPEGKVFLVPYLLWNKLIQLVNLLKYFFLKGWIVWKQIIFIDIYNVYTVTIQNAFWTYKIYWFCKNVSVNIFICRYIFSLNYLCFKNQFFWVNIQIWKRVERPLFIFIFYISVS